jgi:hypothetical protein
MELNIIETTYEVTIGNFIYRLIESGDQVRIKRVPKKDPLWSHGVLTQFYTETGFKIAILVDHPFYVTMHHALGILKDME